MAETEGLHVELTADAQSFISAINNAKNRLAELAAETKILKQGEKDIQAALAESKKKYGETSTQVDKLTADLLDNAREQEKLKQEIKEVNATLDAATKEYKEYGNAAKQSFENTSQQSQKTAETLKSGFNIVKGLIVGYAGKTLYETLIGTNADYEQSMVSFEVLLQSADKADAMMQKLEKMGASTPFELSDLTGATEQLLAYGTAEADVETRLQQLGDLSKGNAEKFESITNAYGRMLAKGKVSLEELNMFTEAGAPILEELQKQYGATGEELYKMISDGKIGIEDINSAMESMTSEGGQFFGMMEKQSKTLEGMLSTMSDNVSMFGRLVGEETFEILKTELEGLLATINEMSESGELQAKAQELGTIIANFVSLLGTLLEFGINHITLITNATGAIITYKAAYAILNSIMGAGQTIQTAINILSGKSVVCKNLETGATIVLTQAELAEAQATKAAIVAQEGFNAVCNANVILALASVLLMLVSALVSYNAATGEATDKTKGLTDSNVELENSYTTAIKSIEERKNSELAEIAVTEKLVDKLLKLGDEYNACGKDTEEAKIKEEEFKAIAEQVAETIPGITSLLYDETGAINIQAGAVSELADNYIKLAKAKAFAAAAEDELTEIAKKIRELEKNKYVYENSQSTNDGLSLGVLPMGGYTNTSKKRIVETSKIMQEVNLAYYNEKFDSVAEELAGYQITINELEGLFSNGTSSSSSSGGTSSSSSKSKTSADVFDDEYEAFTDYISDRNFYDDWEKWIDEETNEADSEVKAYTRLYKKLLEAYNSGIIDSEYFSEKQRALSRNLYTAKKDEYKDRRSVSDEYIKQRDKLDDWDDWGDSKIDAINRIMTYTDEAYKEGVISWNEYREEIEDLSEDLYSELKNMVEEETERVKKQLEEELETKKQYMEDELAYRKQMYDKEIDYLDELQAKRNEEKEDEDYAQRMARLQAKLEYEMDDDNRRALQKEIAELQEEIDDTEFEREIERKKNVLENKKTSEEEKTQSQIDKLTAYYEEQMSDINIAETVYKNLDFEKFKEMGELMGENLAAGISGVMEPYINAISKLVALGQNIQSPANNTVTTTDNSISINQYNNGVSNVPTAAQTAKAIDDYMFLNGRLG